MRIHIPWSMRIHIPCLEVRDQTRMPQGPHIVQPNHHPRFHGALPCGIAWLFILRCCSLLNFPGISLIFLLGSLISTHLLSPPAICYPKEAPCIPQEPRWYEGHQPRTVAQSRASNRTFTKSLSWRRFSDNRG